jgi:hypothetical protein
MKENSETLMKFDGFAAWGWDTEFREALAAHRPDVSYDGKVADRIRLAIVRQFIEFICEVINQEFRLGVMVQVESVGPSGIVGVADLGEDRRAAIAKVEKRAFAGNRTVPDICKEGAPILDRLLTCTEIVFSPDRLEAGSLGELKDECIARIRNDGSISAHVETANPDGTNAYDSFLDASVGPKP